MLTATSIPATTPSAADSLTITASPVSRPPDPERNQLTTDYPTTQNLNGSKSLPASENGLNDTSTTVTVSERTNSHQKER
jgi:hypothetical protein